jgi:hypothetical protein
MTKHYPVLQSYVREVARDLVERGRIRQASGQSIDAIIRQEIEIVIAEVAGDVRALGAELSIGAAVTSARFLELLAKQAVNGAVSVGVGAILSAIVESGRKSRR